MPIYEYRCENGHTFEVIQSMSEDPVSACEVCGAPVERVFHPVAVHFKGSGFYTTDYKGKGKVAAATSDSDGASPSEASKGKSSDTAGSDKGGRSDSAKSGEKKAGTASNTD